MSLQPMIPIPYKLLLWARASGWRESHGDIEIKFWYFLKNSIYGDGVYVIKNKNLMEETTCPIVVPTPPMAAPAPAVPNPPPTAKPKRVVRKRSPAELQEFKLERARKQNLLRWQVEQLRATEADQQLDSGVRGLQLMDLPNEVLSLIFRPTSCGQPADCLSCDDQLRIHMRCRCIYKYRAVCTVLCRRAYYLYRQHIVTLTVSVMPELQVRMYNQLKVRAERPSDWQEQVHTWTPMPALRKIIYRIPNSVGMGDMKALTRSSLPWYYIMAVTTKEQRATMKLRFRGYSELTHFIEGTLQSNFYLMMLQFERIKFADVNGLVSFLWKIDRHISSICHWYRKAGGETSANFQMVGMRWPRLECLVYSIDSENIFHYNQRQLAAFCGIMRNIQIRCCEIEYEYGPPLGEGVTRRRRRKAYKTFRLPPRLSLAGVDTQPPMQQVGETVYTGWV
jgi:hypothetical protein